MDKPWDATEAKIKANSREAYFRDAIRKREVAAKDGKRAQRQAMRECKWCFYFGRGLAGQAFTEYHCKGCGAARMHPNTATPTLCDECGDRLGACVTCGGTREWGGDRG